MNPVDFAILSHVHPHEAGGVLLWTMVVFSAVGGGWGLLALLPFLVRSRSRAWALALLTTTLTTALLVFVVKQIVGRPRPYAAVPWVHAYVFAPPIDPSFPSGHAAGAFTVAAFLLASPTHRRSSSIATFGVAAVILLAAVGVGCSRVYLGVHYPTDVFAAACIGALMGIAGARVHLRSRIPSS